MAWVSARALWMALLSLRWAVAEAPWSGAEWAVGSVALRFDNPRATVFVGLLSDTPPSTFGVPNALNTLKDTPRASRTQVLAAALAGAARVVWPALAPLALEGCAGREQVQRHAMTRSASLGKR